MFATALKFVGFDLQRQWTWLKSEAEEFKNRTTDDIKHKAVNAGLAIGLAFAGLVFVMLAVIAGLASLYLWVGTEYGRFAGLGAVALTAAVFAIVLFAIAASRAKSDTPVRRVAVKAAPAFSPAEPAVASAATNLGSSRSSNLGSSSLGSSGLGSSSLGSQTSVVDAITQDLTDRTMAAANEALETAAGIVKKSPREAILAALAVAVVAGVFVGRRRGS